MNTLGRSPGASVENILGDITGETLGETPRDIAGYPRGTKQEGPLGVFS